MNEKSKKVKEAKINKKSHITPRTLQNKGITLVALIITIIVLLILAVVAIRAVSNDGIISHAKNAQTKYEQAQLNEESILAGYEDIIRKETNPIPGIHTSGIFYTDGTYKTWNEIMQENSKVTKTSIGIYAFRDDKNMKSIIIPEGVISFNSACFSGCSNLEYVKIPNGITSIGFGLFENCNSLKTVEFPDTLKSIDLLCFSGCTGLTSIVIPDGVKSIGDQAFNGCSNLTSVIIPNSVTNIGTRGPAFYGCTKLTIYYSGTAEGAPWGAASVKPYSEAPTE